MSNVAMNIDDFRAAARDDSVPKNAALRAVPEDIEIKATEDDRSVQFTISTEGVDRTGDTIAISGWKLDNYRANPMVLFNHDPSRPIGVADKIWIEDGKLKAVAEFQPRSMSGLADAVYQMLTHPKRFLRAASVGFRPLKYAFSTDPARGYGIDFMEQELLEFSVCAVPANPQALAEAKAAGIDTEPVRQWLQAALAEEGMAIVPKQQIDAALALPSTFRAIAEKVPNKGARSQILRCANIAERELSVGDTKGAAISTDASGQDEAAALADANTDEGPPRRLLMAQRRLTLIRQRSA